MWINLICDWVLLLFYSLQSFLLLPRRWQQLLYEGWHTLQGTSFFLSFSSIYVHNPSLSLSSLLSLSLSTVCIGFHLLSLNIPVEGVQFFICQPRSPLITCYRHILVMLLTSIDVIPVSQWFHANNRTYTHVYICTYIQMHLFLTLVFQYRCMWCSIKT